MRKARFLGGGNVAFQKEEPGCDVLLIMKTLGGKKSTSLFSLQNTCIYYIYIYIIYIYVYTIYLSTTEWMTICLPRVEMGDDTRRVFSHHKNW